MTDDHSFAASDGGVPMIFRSSRASQHGDTFGQEHPEGCDCHNGLAHTFRNARPTHKVTCAGCDCEPGTTCDTRKLCRYCGNHKTYCDSIQPVTCCEHCDHRA